ncbi:DUF3574 domain-containing protein [Streptomyces sp. JJ66]|uniref:DUF3574 domain-containing protein n=1 Tax=Streptomyces sp. JJ66 TaxID=2803843 RepID=UPI001C56FEE1|nr:DUF3574 domain-containing protein [Streptomyces sp. JJ66]MBW1602020.1 DUF3574 domain-containing protein [Streptomyces sp. JJ66]
MSHVSSTPSRNLTWVALLVISLLALGAALAALGTSAWGGPAAPAADPAAARSAHDERYVETRLLFGTGRHNGEPPVTEQQFRAFVDSEVTPRFPAGLTLQEGYGQWRDKDGDINGERSYELTLLYPADSAEKSSAAIEKIRELYTDRWGLESVGRVDEPVTVSW